MWRLNGSTMATTKQTPFDTQQPPQTFSRKQVSHNVRSITKMFPPNNNAGWRKCGRLIVRFVFTSDFCFPQESSVLSARVTTKALPFTHHIQTCHTFHVTALSFFFFIRGLHWLSRASASLFLWAMKKGINRLSQWSVSHCLAHLQPVNYLLARHREDVLNLLLAETWTSPEGATGRAADVKADEQHTWKQSGLFGFKSQKPLEWEQSVCQGARKAFKVLEFSVSSFWLILLNEMKMQFIVTCKVKKTNIQNKSVLKLEYFCLLQIL